MGPLRRLLKYAAFKHNRLVPLYRRLCNPTNGEHAEWLKLHGGLAAIGEHCTIGRCTEFLDPSYVRIGNFVGISNAKFITHNAAVRIVEAKYGVKADSVGRILVHDHVFIGANAIINANVSIGPNAIVAAGSVVTKDVPPNTVVGGNPARVLCSMDDYVERLLERSKQLPWHSLIETRKTNHMGFDPEVEPILRRMREDHFWATPA